MNQQHAFLLMVILISVLWVGTTIKESFGTSPGTLLQLVAKGPQDLYLTGPSYPRYRYHGYGLYPTYSGYRYGYLSPGYPYYGGYCHH